jgi:hypothetical protein
MGLAISGAGSSNGNDAGRTYAVHGTLLTILLPKVETTITMHGNGPMQICDSFVEITNVAGYQYR